MSESLRNVAAIMGRKGGLSKGDHTHRKYIYLNAVVEPWIIEGMEEVIGRGKYQSRSDLVRALLVEFLAKEGITKVKVKAEVTAR